MVLEWLDKVEVGTLALREAVLSVKLKLSSYNWVFTPAVHVKSSFGKNENTGVSYTVNDRSINRWLTMTI